MSSSGPSNAEPHPAGYGKACVACVRGKTKCVFKEGSRICERCVHLSRECRQPSPNSARKAVKRKADDFGHDAESSSRIAKLEEKLDGLVSILSSGIKSGAVAMASDTGDAISQLMRTEEPPATDEATEASYLRTRDSHSRETSELPDPGRPSSEQMLTDFREAMISQFPFISLTDNSVQLHQQQPFLWLCAMAVGSKVTRQKQELSIKIRNTLMEEVLFTQNRSRERALDLLLGILVYTTWSAQLGSKALLNKLVQLALSLVFELGLNKAPTPESTPLHATGWPLLPANSQTPTRSMAERRAVLACFFITSHMSYHTGKVDSLRWTPHLHECMEVLSTQSDWAGDRTLAQLVRMQLIIERMVLTGWYHDTMEAASVKLPASAYLYTLHAELATARASFTSDGDASDLVMMGYHATRLYINEATALNILASPTPITVSQVDCLHACMESARSWFDILFRLPLRVYTDFAFFTMGRGLKCLNILMRLSTFDNSGWDRENAVSSITPLEILDKLIANMEQAVLLAGFDDTGAQEPNVFETFIRTFRSYRVGYITKDDSIVDNAGNVGSLPTPQTSVNDDSMGLLDENDWWLSLLDQHYE